MAGETGGVVGGDRQVMLGISQCAVRFAVMFAIARGMGYMAVSRCETLPLVGVGY